MGLRSFSLGPTKPAVSPGAVERLASKFTEALVGEPSSDVADRILSKAAQFRTNFAKLLGD